MNVWHANTRQEMRADLPAKVHRIASVRVVPVLQLLKTRSRRAVSEVTARKFSLMRGFDYGAVRSRPYLCRGGEYVAPARCTWI